MGAADQAQIPVWTPETPGPSSAAVYETKTKKTQDKIRIVHSEEDVIAEDDVLNPNLVLVKDEMVLERDEEDSEDEESGSDDSDEDEGSYFIDQSGNYYYQATPDSEPVLSKPPKGKYAVDDDDGSEYLILHS